jgi:hypothetical protein
MNPIEQLTETVKTLPEPYILEVLDFAEFIKAKAEKKEAMKPGADFSQFFGLLKDAPVFEGDPVQIQKALRDEWR